MQSAANCGRGMPSEPDSPQQEESAVAKQMVFEDEARQPLAAGVSKLARAVASTLGPPRPQCRPGQGLGRPKVTKDGVTVAEEISLDDPYENLGAQLVKEAASKTNKVAGDGTTTATVLAEAIYREGLQDGRRRGRPHGAWPAASSKATAAGGRGHREDGHRRSTKRTRRKSPRSPPSPATTTRRSAPCWPTPS